MVSSEKFSEVFTLWVFTLKPFPASAGTMRPALAAATPFRQVPAAGPMAAAAVVVVGLVVVVVEVVAAGTAALGAASAL